MSVHPLKDTKSLPTPSIRFWLVYLLAVVFNFHSLLVAYSSTSYMEQFMSPEHIGLLYSLGSLGSIVLFLYTPHILQKLGNVTVSGLYMLLSMVALVVMGLGFSSSLVIIGFTLFLIINPLIYFNIDIFSETLIGKHEGKTGHIRGLTLALMSFASLLAPLTLSILVGDGQNLAQLYFIAIGVGILFTFLVIGFFRRFRDPVYHHIHLKILLQECWEKKNLRVVFTTHFILQIFFTWTVVYFPFYLATEVGLTWFAIGKIIAAGLLAYAIFEYPIGIIADNYIGEKEMMAVGFLVLALACASISFFAGAPIWAWMMLMFISRTGASLVEVTTESYFFKKVDGKDANLMSFFRIMRPFSMLVGSLLGTACLYFMPFNLAFIVLAFVMVVGLFCTHFLQDTR